MQKYIYYAQNLTLEQIDRVEVCLTAEDHLEIHTKVRDILSTMKLESYESQVFAEKMLRLGYIAAHITLDSNLNDYETLQASKTK